MQNIDLRSLIPSLAALVIFISNGLGKPIDEMTAYQLVTALVSLAVVIYGIVASHRKQASPVPVQNVSEPPKVTTRDWP